MKTRILSILFLSLCCVFGAMNIEAQPRQPKVNYNFIPPPPPPPVKPVKKVKVPKFFTPVGHIYGLSLPGHNIIYNFSANGRVYREGDNIGCPYTLQGNIITVYSNYGPQRVVASGKISRDGRHVDWTEFPNGARYRINLIG